MLKQIEGSRAMAETIALCRPDVVCAYPITPQTHIVEALSELVRAGRVGRCEFINVESEFAALSVAIGASASGARAYTATASQGLLFMAEAVYNAGGLGLPIVMTLGNRAIGAPINIWNDHSDAMSMRDAGWIQLFAKDNQEAADLHVQAFRLAEALSCPVMVCVDGFILTHAVERVDVPSQEQVDAFLPPYEPVQTLDVDEPVTIGAMVGPEAFAEVRWLAHQKQLRALEMIPETAAAFGRAFGRLSGGLLRPYRLERAETVVVAMGSVNGTIEEVVDAMRAGGIPIGSLDLCTFRPFPSEAVRAALCGAKRVVVLEKNLAPGMGGVLASDVRMALRGEPTVVHAVVAGLGGRAITRASLTRAFQSAHAGTLEELHMLDLDWGVVERELARGVGDASIGADRVQCPPRRGTFKAEDCMSQQIRFYQTNTLTVGNRLLDPASRTVQASIDRSNALTSGHRACQGCGEALGARWVLDAAMRATGGNLVAVNATGCLEVFTTPYPESAWQLPWLHSLFANASSVATGVAAAMRSKGKSVRVIAQGGDGGTTDIGFGCLSGMFERNDDVLYVCYDNEAYMNTGVQRSSATPPAARTATTPAVGAEPGNEFGKGKNLPLIAMAHGIPYVATASVADLRDLEAKVERAMGVHGARYLHVHVPCPLGWGTASDATLRVARLAVQCGLFPLFEAEYGEMTRSTPIRKPEPVEAYLRVQQRFAHLFAGGQPDTARIAKLQAIADRNVQRFHLLRSEETP